VQLNVSNRRELLKSKGRISHKEAIEKAEKEFDIYRANQLKLIESDFDRAVKQLNQRDSVGDDDDKA